MHKMGLISRFRGLFGNAQSPDSLDAYPTVTARVTKDEEMLDIGGRVQSFLAGLNTIAAKFPFEIYDIMDCLVLTDPYVSKFHNQTISLGNTGHSLELDAPSEARAREAVVIANDLAARCFPYAGGMDGLVNGLFSQIGRSGGLCVEWVPSLALQQIDRAYVVPVKTIRFRYGSDGDIELCQLQNGVPIPLNPVQAVFHTVIAKDSNPYPVPPAIAALGACANHKAIGDQIKAWMEKVSALGVLLAEVTPPPRTQGESQDEYNNKAKVYLQDIAKSITDNLSAGVGVGYNNIQFKFNSTQSGAQGAKDILQIVLQAMFAGLHRDPVFFGWAFNKTETFAKIVYEELVQGIKTYQLGVKRAIEHGHRLNLALNGMGDVGVSVRFHPSVSTDAFRDAEAMYMETQAILAQLEQGVITPDEARKLLGYDEVKPTAGAFVASFTRSKREYTLLDHTPTTWSGVDLDSVKDEGGVKVEDTAPRKPHREWTPRLLSRLHNQ